MISILIPCYNYNAVALVKSILKQAMDIVDYEILVFDDCSDIKIREINREINLFDHCAYTELPKNIGRSRIRNLMAKNAKYEILLFLDVDTMPIHKGFIAHYLKNSTKDIIYGGVKSDTSNPQKNNMLRRLYMNKRQVKQFGSANFLIKKSIFLESPFDETITTYGYEDVVFFQTLLKKGYTIHRIENPVEHHCLDTTLEYITKIEEAENTLNTLINKNIMGKSESGIYHSYCQINKLGLSGIVIYLFKNTKKLILKNLKSSKPSLLLFNLYRLGYFCTIRHNK